MTLHTLSKFLTLNMKYSMTLTINRSIPVGHVRDDGGGGEAEGLVEASGEVLALGDLLQPQLRGWELRLDLSLEVGLDVGVLADVTQHPEEQEEDVNYEDGRIRQEQHTITKQKNYVGFIERNKN